MFRVLNNGTELVGILWGRNTSGSATLSAQLVLRNRTSRTLEPYLRGREIEYDLTVTDDAGRTVWNRLHDVGIPAILRLDVIAPGDSIVLTHDWNVRTNEGAPVTAGVYHMSARLLTEGRDIISAPSRLPVTRRSLR